MNPAPQSLRTVQLHGPPLPGGAPGETFWAVTLGAPHFSRHLQQEDRTHPVRTLLLDVRESLQGGARWRQARLLSQHVIGGFPGGHYADLEELQFHVRIGTASAVQSKDGSVFYTGQAAGEPTAKEVEFQHIVATPLLPPDDAWPPAHATEIRLPACRLVQGAIPLFVVRERVPWLAHASNPLGLVPFTFGRDRRVRLGLAPDGIVLDASAPLPQPDGSLVSVAGRFLLVPTAGGGAELRLLPAQLSEAQRGAWSAAWERLAPQGDAAAEALPGFKVELRRGGLPPAFAWRLRVAGGVITGFEKEVRVPGEAVLVRMLGPATAEGREGEARLQPAAWLLTPPGSAGAVGERALADASKTIWKKVAADWGDLPTTVETWAGRPILSALLLPPVPPGHAPARHAAPPTALRLDALSPTVLEAQLIGRAGQPAAHALAHDETLLAQALRAVHGLPEHPPGERDPERPLLAGFVPLSDGWLQLPVPNLPLPDPAKDSELVAPPVPVPPSVLAGFLRFGEVEKLPGVLSAFPGQPGGDAPLLAVERAPWLATVEGTQALAVAIALGGAAGPTRAAAVLLGPELSTRGLLWFSADRPDALEGLPRIGAGAGAFLDVPLESHDTERAPVLPVTLRRLRWRVERLAGGPDLVTRQALELACEFHPADTAWWQTFEEEARVTDWAEALRDGPGLRALNEAWRVVAGGTLPDLRAGRAVAPLPPVLWLRHPAMPLAATMPMTRSASSAVRPLESRDLVPLVVAAPPRPEGGPALRLAWDAASGSVFPQVRLDPAHTLRPAAGWPFPDNKHTAGIALAAFGVPGAELRLPDGPAAELPALWASLEFALRFDLPALDEAFATASLPPAPEVRTPEATDLPPPSVPLATALDWRALGRLWAHQSRRHQLARVRHSHLDDYATMGPATPRRVRNLVGGAVWTVAFGFEPSRPADLPYGAALFAGSLPASGNAALLGVSGEVEVVWEKPLGAARSTVSLVGYAVPTIVDPAPTAGDADLLVDARGTGTGPMRDLGPVWRRRVFARSRGANDAAAASDFELVTSRRELEVRPIAGAPALFRFWFKDVPSDLATTEASAARDTLDPNAWGDGRLPRAGAEWRLWPADQDAMGAAFARGRDRLPFFGFGLEPLRLRECAVAADGTPGEAVIRCRLHLGPRQGGPEPGGNLADLRLAWDAGVGSYVIAGLEALQHEGQPVALIFPLRCRETADLSRRVEISAEPGWVAGEPNFSQVKLSVAMLGEEVLFEQGAELSLAVTPTGEVTLTWHGSAPPPTLPPGAGQMGIEEITVRSATETVQPQAIPPPTITLDRWLALLPATGEAGEAAARPALFVRAQSGQPLELRAFGVPLTLAAGAELREERGAVTFTGTGAGPIEPFPGFGKRGVFSAGLLARVGGFAPQTGIGQLTAGYLSGRWTEGNATGAPDRIVLESACRQRVPGAEPRELWSGALTLHLRWKILSAIRWPSLLPPLADGPPFPSATVRHGRETLRFHPAEGTGFAHEVELVLDGHCLSFATASRLADADDGGAIFSAPAMTVHTLTARADGKKLLTWTAVETVAYGRAMALIPQPADAANPPARPPDRRTFGSDPLASAGRYQHLPTDGNGNKRITAPGMVAPGQGRISTVLSGALGHAFRAAFWDGRAGNPLALIGGFAGFVGPAAALAAPDSAAPLLRLPLLALPDEALVIEQSETSAEVAWADGSGALPVALAWRAAAAPASPSLGALRAALLAGAGPAFAEAEIEAAILVEQSFRVPMDAPKKGALAVTLFFPAAAVAVARLLPPHREAIVEPIALSLVAGRAAREVAGRKEHAPFAASLLTRTAPSGAPAAGTPSAKGALGPDASRPRLATLGEEVVVAAWEGPPAKAGTVFAAPAARAFAEHAEPRAALLVQIADNGSAEYSRAALPTPGGRARFEKPLTTVAFADPGRGFGLGPGGETAGWLRGLEEGPMTPFRDAEPAGTEPVTASGLAGLGRRLALPAQAAPLHAPENAPHEGPVPVWTAETRVPVYHALGDLHDAVAPPLSWLAPGQPRPRLPVPAALAAALGELFGPNVPPVQWVLPGAMTSASVGDRAGIALARTLRLETPFAGAEPFDFLFARFGRPAQGGAWNFRTERTPRPGPLPANGDDPARNRRPCASRLEPRRPVEVLRGPADTISGEPHPGGEFGAWVVKFVAAPEWDGMVAARWDGTLPVDVEIDIASGAITGTPGDWLLRLLMPAASAGTLRNVAALAVGERVFAFRRMHFLPDIERAFAPLAGVAGVMRGALRVVFDPRSEQDLPLAGALSRELAEALRAGFSAPPVELRLTVLPDSERPAAPVHAGPLALTQVDPQAPALPSGSSRPPVTLRLPLMPLVRSRGALPLPPNSLLFIDSAYDADLGSQPAMDRRRVGGVRVAQHPLPTERGDLFATLYADRDRVNRRASVVFMLDLAFERPLDAAAQAAASATAGEPVDGDIMPAQFEGHFELVLSVTTRDGVRRDLLFGTPGSPVPTAALPLVALATVYELPLGLVLETDRTPARLAAGDMFELTVSEPTLLPAPGDTKRPLNVARRAQPALWDAQNGRSIPLLGLSDAGGPNAPVDEARDIPLARTVRVLLTDEPVVEPPPALYAALVRRTQPGAPATCQLSLPLYAQSPLPWRVTLRDAKADFRRGYLRRAATFIWNLARPAAELPATGIHIVKADRNGQTYLPPTATAAAFPVTRRIPEPTRP